MSRLSLDMTKWLPRHAGEDRLGVNLIQIACYASGWTTNPIAGSAAGGASAWSCK